MELLISKADVESYFQIAIGRKEAEFDNFINEAQTFDFKPLFKPAFWADMMANLEADKYVKVLGEYSYTYNDVNYTHLGLKAVLIQLAYGVYLFKNGIVDTSFGMVTKKTPQSEPLEYKERRDWLDKHKTYAKQLFAEVEMFVEKFPDTYPLWCEGVAAQRSFKTRIINKD